MNNHQLRQIIHANFDYRYNGKKQEGVYWLIRHGYKSHLAEIKRKELLKILKEMETNKRKWVATNELGMILNKMKREIEEKENWIKKKTIGKWFCKLFGHKLRVVGTIGYGENLYCSRCNWEGKRVKNFTNLF